MSLITMSDEITISYDMQTLRLKKKYEHKYPGPRRILTTSHYGRPPRENPAEKESESISFPGPAGD